MNRLLALLLLCPCLALANGEVFFRQSAATSVVVGPICAIDIAGVVVESTFDFNLANLVITVTTPASGTSFNYTGGDLDDGPADWSTWGNPAASAIEVSQIATGAHTGCVMLHLRDEVLAVANALEWGIAWTDGGAAIMSGQARILATDTVGDAWDEATAGHTTAGTFGEQLKTDVDAILVDTGTTLDAKLDTTVAALESGVMKEGAINCEVNTANFPGSSTTFACVLTTLAGNPITAATSDLTGKEVQILSGTEIRELRFINSTTWDGANSELQITLSRALGSTLADAVTARIY